MMSDLTGDRRSMAGRTLQTADHEPIGTVEAVEGLAMLATRDGARIYVPFAAIQSVDDDEITLAVNRRDLDVQGWETPPSEGMDAVATTTSISTDDIGIAESPGLDETAPDTPFPFGRRDDAG
jgi:hypothetical protein